MLRHNKFSAIVIVIFYFYLLIFLGLTYVALHNIMLR